MLFDTLNVVVGGQFGSESKGRVAADLVDRARAYRNGTVYSVRVAGPNAGHVVVGKNGEHLAMRQLPVGFINPDAMLVIAAGSEVDEEVLLSEIRMVEAAGYSVRDRLLISPEATILEPHHIEQEKAADLNGKVGSTAKGIGAARADRIWRNAQRVVDDVEFGCGVLTADNIREWLPEVRRARREGRTTHVVIEGTQGYGLGLHAGHYPQCTSSDCRAIDFLAMAGTMPWEAEEFAVHVVVRPNPIRVAGNSGELKGETTWEDLNLPPELTTVTKKIRRVGQFDLDLVREAVQANGGPERVMIHLAMADTIDPTLCDLDPDAPSQEYLERLLTGPLADVTRDLFSVAQVAALGLGPNRTQWLEGFYEVDDTVYYLSSLARNENLIRPYVRGPRSVEEENNRG